MDTYHTYFIKGISPFLMFSQGIPRFYIIRLVPILTIGSILIYHLEEQLFTYSCMEKEALNRSNEIKGISLAVLSATIFGIHPTMVYHLRSGGMGISPTLFVSCVQCCTIYTIVLVITKRVGSLRVTREQLVKMLLSSILVYSTLWVLFYSFTLIPTGLASVIHFAYPSLVTIISVLTRRDKLTKALLIALVTTFFGVVLVSNPTGSDLNSTGIFLAALSAVLFSSYIYMINDDCFKELGNTTFMFYTTLMGALILMVLIIIESSFISSTTAVWGTYSTRVLWAGLLLGSTQSIGNFSFSKGIKLIGGPMGGALAAFEPLTAVAIGVIFFSEAMPLYCIIGCLLILGATVFLSISKLRLTDKKPTASIMKQTNIITQQENP